MKFWLVAFTLSLVAFTDANKQLLCKAGEGSVLHFLVRDKAQSINCVSNSTDFEVTKDQYDNIMRRLAAAENDLSITKLALVRSLDEATAQPDASNDTRTQQMIDDAVNKTLSQMLPKLVKDVKVRIMVNNGWVQSGDYVFKVFKDRVDYNTATTRCLSHGGRLAAEVLRHPDVIRYIAAGNFANTYKDGTEPWIGYNDRQRESYWRWVDGGRTNPSTTEWRDGEPNSANGNEDCGSISKTLGGKILLNDADCGSELHYICEVNLNQIN